MVNQNKTLTLTRVFDAPREQVWKAWTDPKLLEKWWGPKGVTNPVCKFDVKQNGAIHIVMVAGEELGDLKGAHWPMRGTVKEIVEQSRLVFATSAIEDEEGNMNLETINTVTFESEGEKTKMTLHIQVVKATEKAQQPLAGMEMGWSQSLYKLGKLVEEKV